MSTNCTIFVFLSVFLNAVVLSEAHVFINPLTLIKRNNIYLNLDESVQIIVKPDVINSSYLWVSVSISGVASPSPEDWLGLFTLSENDTTIDARQHAPVKFQYCSDDSGYLTSGTAQFYFYLINMRHDYMIGFFTGGLDSPVLVSTSNRITVTNPNEPLQGHLALTRNIDEIILQWITKNTTDPMVHWGTQTGTYTYSKQANNSRYTVEDMCGSPARDYGWMDAGTIHTVIMDNLKPSTRYYYQFGSYSNGWSKEFSFMSPPLTGPNSAVRIITYGDLGHGEKDDTRQVKELEQASLNTTKNVYKEINETDLIVHIGDLSYAVGFSAQWDEYYSEIELLSANAPYMVCPGNHETDWPNTTSYFQSYDSGGECNIPYIYRNPMPRESPTSPWYGFDFGCIHFVMMSTENNFTIDTPQYKFLVQHLQNIDRAKTPWLIFTGHRPMYVDSNSTEQPYGMQPIAKLLRDSLEDVLMKYKVNIALWGHHHTYQRTCKLYQGQCVDDGVMHIIIGMAGRPLLQDFEYSPPGYFEYLDDKHFGFTRIQANESILVFQYVRNDDLQVHDEIVLKNTQSLC